MKKESRRSQERGNEIDMDARMMEARRLQERELELRELDSMEMTSPFNIPPEIIPQGWSYRWVRIGIKEAPDAQNQGAALRDGWSPVPADRHPTLMQGFMEGAKHDGNHIIYGQSVLCEMPTSVLHERMRKIYNSDKERIYGMQALNNAMSNFNMFSNPNITPRVIVNETFKGFGG